MIKMWIRNIRTPFRGVPMIFGTFWDTIGQGLLRVGIVRFGFSSDDREVPAELVCSVGDSKVKPTLGCPAGWTDDVLHSDITSCRANSLFHRTTNCQLKTIVYPSKNPVAHRMAFSGWAPSIEGTHLRKTLGKVKFPDSAGLGGLSWWIKRQL